jgi:hypothetical protein
VYRERQSTRSQIHTVLVLASFVNSFDCAGSGSLPPAAQSKSKCMKILEVRD